MVSIIITLIIVGVVLWLVNNKIPMDSTFKTVINVVAIVCVGLWLLSCFGVIGPVPMLHTR